MSNVYSKKSMLERDDEILPGSLVRFITDEGLAEMSEINTDGLGLVVGACFMRGCEGTFGYRHYADVLWGNGRIYGNVNCEILDVVFSGVEQLSGSV